MRSQKRLGWLLFFCTVLLSLCVWMQWREIKALNSDLQALERENQVQATAISLLSRAHVKGDGRLEEVPRNDRRLLTVNNRL